MQVLQVKELSPTYPCNVWSRPYLQYKDDGQNGNCLLELDVELKGHKVRYRLICNLTPPPPPQSHLNMTIVVDWA